MSLLRVRFLSLICGGRIHKFPGTILREKFTDPFLWFLTQGKKDAIKGQYHPLCTSKTYFSDLKVRSQSDVRSFKHFGQKEFHK